MELFRNLRLRAGRSILTRKSAKTIRKPHYTNFYSIRTIAIVWDASKPEDFLKLSHFHQEMAERKINVSVFGYFPGKELPNQYTAIRFLTCLKMQEIDFFFRPLGREAENFISTRFDVLIDINFRKVFPLVYATTLSHAGLKVGIADSKPESSPFDLMISMKKPVNLENYIEQVIHYLTMINSESAKEAV